MFAAIVGSISFWGSNIAFGKLQELISGRPLKLPGGVFVNGALLLIAIARRGRDRSPAQTSEWLFIVLLVAAGALGVLAVLPIGGADMPVVISTLNAFTGLSAAAAGVALDNTALIVAGMLVGASGTILTDLMAKAMNRSIAYVLLGGFGGAHGRDRRARRRARTAASCAPRAPPTRRSSSPTRARSSSSPATAWPSRRPSTPCARWPRRSRSAGSRSPTRSTPSRAGCRGT